MNEADRTGPDRTGEESCCRTEFHSALLFLLQPVGSGEETWLLRRSVMFWNISLRSDEYFKKS